MPCIEYLGLDEVDPEHFLPLLNKQTIREHLVGHPLFDPVTVKTWWEGKISMDSLQGCKVRAINIDKRLAGWCGIQLENKRYELAVVLDDDYWGQGRSIFREIMRWAKELGHETVFIHLLYTRPEYNYLRKIAKAVYQSELLGTRFTTYELAVE